MNQDLLTVPNTIYETGIMVVYDPGMGDKDAWYIMTYDPYTYRYRVVEPRQLARIDKEAVQQALTDYLEKKNNPSPGDGHILTIQANRWYTVEELNNATGQELFKGCYTQEHQSGDEGGQVAEASGSNSNVD